jgi:hypothetical protein
VSSELRHGEFTQAEDVDGQRQMILQAVVWNGDLNPRQREGAIREMFGADLRLCKDRGPPSTFVDKFDLEWVLAPGGVGVVGISDREIAAALDLSESPFLSFDEMRPQRIVEFDPFLCLQTPVMADKGASVGIAASGAIGPDDAFGLWNREQALSLSEHFSADIPSEIEWEVACRGGTRTLFWFGNSLPDDDELPRHLGMARPFAENPFGISCLFFGEWCNDFWSKDHLSAPTNMTDFIVKGGAAQFWPWQDGREWAGCASAFRMPSSDLGEQDIAVRLVRHPLSN